MGLQATAKLSTCGKIATSPRGRNRNRVIRLFFRVFLEKVRRVRVRYVIKSINVRVVKGDGRKAGGNNF